MGQAGLVAAIPTAAASTTTARAGSAFAADLALGPFADDFIDIAGRRGVGLRARLGALGVDGIEPDVGILERRRPAAHPVEPVALAAFFTHPASAAASATATTTAFAVVVILASGGGSSCGVVSRGFGAVATSAATTTATAATVFAFGALGAFAGFVVVRVLAVEGVVVGNEFLVVAVVFILERAVVEVVVEVDEGLGAFLRDEVLVG
ncbi:hypothetical protein [Brevundimonas sp. Root1423]|uniref:hypothetical protein n=1 Tax=Brevundimonas sp. Root1423 TaxID=1736462 RepID=UPI001F48448D|nr:hypothetical protein [Brevundimonas sp. Root1423]